MNTEPIATVTNSHSVTLILRTNPRITTIHAAIKWILEFGSTLISSAIPLKAYSKDLMLKLFFDISAWFLSGSFQDVIFRTTGHFS
jgi:hypothetical protein